MQTQLPIFPSQIKLINSSLGVRRQDDFVYYLHNGSPVFCHHIDDQNNYRYILGNLVTSGLCRCSELADALGVNRRNVERYAQSLRENGSDWFFGRPSQRGRGYKFSEQRLERAQKLLNDEQSVVEVGKELGVSEGAVRYQIKKGRLKKSF